MDDDFNTALAIGHIFELIRVANKYLDGKPTGPKAVELVFQSCRSPERSRRGAQYFQAHSESGGQVLDVYQVPCLTEEFILDRIKARQAARDRKKIRASLMP